MSARVLMSPSPEKLHEELSRYFRTATVEAEYGDTVVEGTVVTLAHHGSRSGNPAPCLWDGNWNCSIHCDQWSDCANATGPEADRIRAECMVPIPERIEAVGISHIDLDSLGGVLAVLGQKPGDKRFWMLAAHIDVQGVHRAAESPDWKDFGGMYHAYCAWVQAQPKPDRLAKDEARDVTEQVERSRQALIRIFAGDENLLADGREFARTGEALEGLSFRGAHGTVLERLVEATDSDPFVNHLYRHGDVVYEAVVTLHRGVKLPNPYITVSFEDGGKRCSAREIVQKLWGPKAGGHNGIAGSPWGCVVTEADLATAIQTVREALRS